jgi:hypothetical protein
MNWKFSKFLSPLAALLPLVLATVAGAAAPLQLTLSYQNDAWRKMSEPPVMQYAAGYMFVTARWETTFTNKDDVSYLVWIDSQKADWASANAPNDAGAAGQTGWRQYAYLGTSNQGSRSSVTLKMSFDYRRPGLSSYPIEGADRQSVIPLPEAMPLQPGKYRFTLHVQRNGPGSQSAVASQPFEVIIGGDAAQGSVSGLSDYQILQRKDKKTGDAPFRLIAVPTHTAWKATVSKEGQPIASASGTTSTPAEACTVPNIPVGGPYTVQIDAGSLKAVYKNLYVGDLWIVSGQSNAVGVGHEKEFYRKPMPGVHGLNPKYGILEWAPAQDGFFENTMGPWVTAAQDFYTQTGVPVGLVGQAVGSRAMDYFYDARHENPIHLRPLIEQHAIGAPVFLWYQGESDSWHPETINTYGAKLKGLVTAVRALAHKPDMIAGVVQLARYTWQHDEHFAPVREAQRQFVLHDPRALLYSTMPYVVNKGDRIHITSAGQAALGKQIAASLVAYEKTGQLDSLAPKLEAITFASPDHKMIRIRFTEASQLHGNPATDEWFVTDQKHGGFHAGGFVPIDTIQIDADQGTVTLQLKEAPGPAAAVSYGYQANIGGSLVNGAGFPAPCFVKVPVK